MKEVVLNVAGILFCVTILSLCLRLMYLFPQRVQARRLVLRATSGVSAVDAEPVEACEPVRRDAIRTYQRPGFSVQSEIRFEADGTNGPALQSPPVPTIGTEQGRSPRPVIKAADSGEASLPLTQFPRSLSNRQANERMALAYRRYLAANKEFSRGAKYLGDVPDYFLQGRDEALRSMWPHPVMPASDANKIAIERALLYMGAFLLPGVATATAAAISASLHARKHADVFVSAWLQDPTVDSTLDDFWTRTKLRQFNALDEVPCKETTKTRVPTSVLWSKCS